MGKASGAISVGIAALIVIVIILITGFGIYLGTTFTSPTLQTTATSSYGGAYNVAFDQISACNPEFWGVPWSVSIGNITKVEPSNTHIPLNNNNLSSTFNPALSRISFVLGNGTYSYTVKPSQGFFTPDSGSIIVAGSNQTIHIRYTGTSCTETTNTATTQGANTSTTSYLSNSSTVAALTSCTISGQPGGIAVRILSDSTLMPVSGAEVEATNQPAYCGSVPADQVSTMNFTTTNTEWYSLPSENNAGYSFTVSYSGENYTFSASLEPVSMTCATLYLPSGHSNVTITEYSSTC